MLALEYGEHGLDLGAGVVRCAATCRSRPNADASIVLKPYGHALPNELAGAADTVAAWLEGRRIVTVCDTRGRKPARSSHG